MTIKPFAIQGADLTLGGINLQAGTSGVVIPGVTQATSYKVEEVNDTGDQTHRFAPDSEVVVVDYVLYNVIVAQGNESLYADYTATTDGEGYIDNIQVNGRGAYTSQESTDNAANNMYAYIGSASASDRPLVPQDWIQIPFRPKMRAGAVETIGGGGGGSALVNGDYAFTLNSNGTITLPKGVIFNGAQHTQTFQGGDFITIQGTTGFYTNYAQDSTYGGEGTSISLQAGLGGESGDYHHGGRGGQLDIISGGGQHGADGGSINIVAGAATWAETNVRGGDVNISAGWANNQNQISAGHGTGGNLNLKAGLGNSAGGLVTIQTSDDYANSNYNKQWTFGPDGQLTLPANSAGDSVIFSNAGNVELYTNKSDASVKIRAKGTGGDSEWIFNNNGSITFPDTTVQSTAYTGAGGTSGSANINNWLLDITTANTATGFIAAISAVEYDTLGNVLAIGFRTDGGPGQAVTVMKFDTHGNLIWQNLFADSVQVDGFGLAVDNNNDVMVSGQYNNNKLFLLKVSGATGNGIWGTAVADASTATTTTSLGLTVDVDSHNDIIVAGYITDTTNNSYNDDFIVAKFNNTDGSNIWARKLGDVFFDQDSYGLGVGALNQNEIVVVGYNEHYIGGTVTGVSSVQPTTNPAWTGTDITVVLPNNNNHGLEVTVSFVDGVPSFTIVNGASGWYSGNSVTVDGALIGGASGTDNMILQFNVDQPYANNNNALIAKYDTDGVLQWQREFSVAGSTYSGGADADIDSTGNVYLAGNYGDNTSTWGIVAQFSPVGDLNWSRQIGLGSCFAGNSSIVVGADNIVYVGGMASVGSPNNITDANVFLGAYDESGTVQWQRTYGNPDRVETVGAIFANSGASNFDVHGDYLVFGGGNYNNFIRDGGYPSDQRGFLFQMDKSGAEQYWGNTTLVRSYLPEAAVTLTVTTSTLPDVAWTVTQTVTEPPYQPDGLTINKSLGSLGNSSGSELVNGTKILTLNSNGTVTPPTIGSTATLAVNGNVSVARPQVGFAVTQGNNNSDTWGTANEVDAAGNIYVVGGWYDWDWDGEDRPTVIKYSPAGQKLWETAFRYDGNLFGGTSYNIEYDAGHDTLIVVIDNWYNHHRTQVMTLDATTGSVIKSDEISTDNNNYFHPRGLALDSTGTWVVAGQARNTIASTTGTKAGLPGSTYGILVLPKSYFSTWGQYPQSQSNWDIKTTYGVDNYSLDYVYYVNRYYNIPTFNLIGAGTNFALDIEYSTTSSEVTYQSQVNGGSGYAPGDAVYIRGIDLGATTSSVVLADAGAGLALVGTATVITTVTPNADWNIVAAGVASTSSWRAVIYNDGSNIEAVITNASVDIVTNIATLTLDVDYSASLTTATSNIIVYDSTSSNLVFFVTAVDTNAGSYVTNNNRFGLVHSDTVRIDTQNGRDFGALYQQTLLNNPGGATANFIKVAKADYPRWADIQLGWSWNDGSSSGIITGLVDNNDGFITYNLDNGSGSVLGDGAPVTVTDPIQQYQPVYSTNDDGGVVTSDGIEFTWGTPDNNNQEFNVVEYGSDRTIYAAGYAQNSGGLGDTCLLVKFNAQGTAVLWHKLFQGTSAGYDYGIHGLEVITEQGTEYAYVITTDDGANGMLYKIDGATGAVVWCSYVLGNATGTSIRWARGAAIRVATNGEIVVAGLAYVNNLHTNSQSLVVIRLNPSNGNLIGAQEIINNLNNDISSSYEGDESDFQFELHSITSAGITTEYFVASVYTYTGNRDEAVTIKIPLAESVMAFSQSIFNIYNITSAIGGAVYTTTAYQTGTYTNAAITLGKLTRTANSNHITNDGAPYWGTDLHSVIKVLGGDLGAVTGVKALTFEDGSSQLTAYAPVMQSVIDHSNYYYYPTKEDAGKFVYCDGQIHNIEIPDDTRTNLPIGWALTIIAPLDRDVGIYKTWNNYPPTMIVPGNDPQTNPNSDYSGWTLKAGGMITVLKVAANTFYLSGGKLEPQ